MTSPVVTIYVRHSAGCKYEGDEFAKRCDCRKHFRWTVNGKRERRKAETRSWAEAEMLKREIEDALAGRAVVKSETPTVRYAVDAFFRNKRTEGVSDATVKKYTTDLERFADHCEASRVFSLTGLTSDFLARYCALWTAWYPSSVTRSKARERLRTFLRFCYDSEWLTRVPPLPKIKVDEPPTMPLTSEEFTRLLDALYVTNPKGKTGRPSSNGLTDAQRGKVRALFLLMRWSGLAIRDALTLRKSGIIHRGDVYRVETSRQKTGTHVSVVIPESVAVEILSVASKDGAYIFWSGNGNAGHLSGKWAERYVRPAFEAAGIPCDSHMVSHRLRDTFAVHLLERGVPMEEVSKALGHESIKTTEKHYAKWVRGRQDRLDTLISATW